MPDETTQPNPEPAPTPSENQNSEVSSTPVSPQEPISDASIPTIDSDTIEALPDAPESPTEAPSAVPVKDDISANEPLETSPTTNVPNEPNNPNITIERNGNDVTITEVMPARHDGESGGQPTAQMAGNEPLGKWIRFCATNLREDVRR